MPVVQVVERGGIGIVVLIQKTPVLNPSSKRTGSKMKRLSSSWFPVFASLGRTIVINRFVIVSV